MPKSKWLIRTNPKELLKSYTTGRRRTKADPRLLRLCACAFARQLEPRLRPEDEVCRTALAAAEAMADGRGDPGELASLAEEVAPSDPERTQFPDGILAIRGVFQIILEPDPFLAVSTTCLFMEMFTAPEGVSGPETPILVSLIRDILANPFSPPVPVTPACLTPDVTALANATYADGAFERLPILADALEEAGCEDEEILAHCRGPGPHTRGCWAVDLARGIHRT